MRELGLNGNVESIVYEIEGTERNRTKERDHLCKDHAQSKNFGKEGVDILTDEDIRHMNNGTLQKIRRFNNKETC